MRAALTRQLRARDGVLVLGALGFENAYALAMRRARAEALGVRTLDDLARAAPRLTPRRRPRIPHPARMALGRGRATASISPPSAPTARPSCTAPSPTARPTSSPLSPPTAASPRLDLVTLADPRRALPSYDAVLLARAGHRRRGRSAALRPLIGAIPVERMRQANLMVDRDEDKRTPAEAARWLDP